MLDGEERSKKKSKGGKVEIITKEIKGGTNKTIKGSVKTGRDGLVVQVEKKRREKREWNKKRTKREEICVYLRALDSVHPLGPVSLLLLLAGSEGVGLLGGETTTDGAGLLDSQVKGLEVLAAVELLELSPGVLVDDGVDARYALPDLLDLGQLGGGAASHLLDAEAGKLGLQVTELLEQFSLVLLAELVSLDLHHLCLF
ncbi:hypothetical protein QOT17_005751 [Balamuthia mandrillaris]